MYSKQPIKDEESYEKKLSMTREYLTPASNVLEFGCGTGGTALLHAPHVKEIRAIDLSAEMIKIANEKAESQGVKNVKFEQMGIDRLDVPDESYDVILGLSILHLLPQKDQVLQKVHRMLKPNGVFVSSTTCLGDVAKAMKWISPPATFLGLLPQMSIFTAQELKDSLIDAGFVIEEEFHPGKDKAIFLIAKKK